jgi:transposase
MQIHSVGIDLGKTTFHLVALGAAGKVLVRKKFTQKQLLAYTANMQTSLIGLEACSGAHFLGRALHKQGHDDGRSDRAVSPSCRYSSRWSRRSYYGQRLWRLL